MRGNCCPDADRKVTQLPVETCEATIVRQNKLPVAKTYNGMVKGVRRYYVTKQCPETETNVTTALKCTGRLQTTLDDVIWVTDVRTNRIYYNRYCADCHGITNYKEWDLGTNCYAAFQDDPHTTDLTTLPDSCALTIKPTNTKDAAENLCVLPDIKQCNSSGLWQKYESDIERLCESQSHNQYFVEDNLFWVQTFKNVFCYVCNKPSGTEVRHVCRSPEFGGKGLMSSFTVILETGYWKSTSPSTQRKLCRIDEVKDPLQVLYQILYIFL